MTDKFKVTLEHGKFIQDIMAGDAGEQVKFLIWYEELSGYRFKILRMTYEILFKGNSFGYVNKYEYPSDYIAEPIIYRIFPHRYGVPVFHGDGFELPCIIFV